MTHQLKTSWLRLLALLLILAVALTACGEPPADPDADPEPVTLVYGLMHMEYSDRLAVARFNEAHEDVQIEIRDYAEYADGTRQLLKELMAGNGPDILDLRFWPYRQLAEQGYLEDLWPWIEGDPELGREALMEAPLRGAEIDGGLYMVFSNFYICTLVGAANVVGDRYGWTPEDLWAALDTLPEGSTAMSYATSKEAALRDMLMGSLDSYLDWDRGACSFDSDRFRTALAFCDSFPTIDDIDWTSNEAVNAEIARRKRDGMQLTEVAILGQFNQIQQHDKIWGPVFGGKCSFVGFPTADGSVGSYFVPDGRRVGMNAACQEKEAAWEFVRQWLLTAEERHYGKQGRHDLDGTYNEAYTHEEWTFAVNRSDFERLARKEMTREESLKVPVSSSLEASEYIEITAVTQEEYDRFMDFFNSVESISLYDPAVMNIVVEQCGPFFAGDRTLDETVQAIQDRVTLYVNENI